jgi:hypothetical protein
MPKDASEELTKGRLPQLPELGWQEVFVAPVETLSSAADTGPKKGDPMVLEMDLRRIEVYFHQPHRIVASRLHDRLREVMKSCREITGQLRRRRERDDRVCLTP